MNRIIQTGVRTHTALETTRAAIDFSEQLDLQPPVVMLNRLDRFERPGKLGDPDEASVHYRDTDIRDVGHNKNMEVVTQLTGRQVCHP